MQIGGLCLATEEISVPGFPYTATEPKSCAVDLNMKSGRLCSGYSSYHNTFDVKVEVIPEAKCGIRASF